VSDWIGETTMTGFYFHIRDGDQVERDLEGIELQR
jgi:hypothetical protein